MVSAAPLGLDEALAGSESDADSEVIVGSLDAGAEQPPDETPDPLEDIRAQLGAAARREELESLRNQVRSELGRSQRLEARLDALSSNNPLADVDPRLEANEALLTTLASVLVNSLDDAQSIAALRAALSGLDQAKGVRAERKMRAELKDEILAALPQPQERAQEPPIQTPEQIAATNRVLGYADAKGVDPTRIPDAAWTTLPGETFDQAVQRVRGVIDALAAGDASTERVATRRQAAGAGAPSRNGATGPVITNMSEADDAYTRGLITGAQYANYRDTLPDGVGSAPGGGR